MNRNNLIFFLLAVLTVLHSGCHVNENYSLSKSVLYQKGMDALKAHDTTSAEKIFDRCSRDFGDTQSLFELSKIYLHRNTYSDRSKAYETLRKITFIEPNNIEYRLAFAKLMREYARVSSVSEFKHIVELDSSQVEAWLNLAEMKDEDFSEYNNSVRVISDEFSASLQEYADDDFSEAERCYQNAIKYDSTNYDANYKLALLYEKAGKPEKGIPFLERLVKAKKDDKNVHLCMGLFFYKIWKMVASYNEYQKALTLMSSSEREDFTFNSVRFLIEPAYNDVVEKSDDYELRQFIEVYWKVFDPLYLTDFNERLLEHYSRVAYADLFYSVPKMGKVGWKTDRGEAVLRYGEPLNFTRIRPSMEADGVNMKTEVWNYKNMSLGFTDFASSGNYLFSAPDAPKSHLHTQFKGGDTQYLFDNLRRLQHTYYEPEFEGPGFNVQYSIAQFKSLQRRNQADVYVNYILDNPDSLYAGGIDSITYTTGLFFINEKYEDEVKDISKIEVRRDDGKSLIKSLEATAIPDSGFTSFELIRNSDKGASSNRNLLRIKKFSNYHLDISDVLLARYAGEDTSEEAVFSRKKIKIIPNPSMTAAKNDPLYIYFEVYNLKKGTGNLTDFEQKITIKEFEEVKSGLADAAESVLNFLGINKKEEITLSSNYQTFETDPQIYFQLDLGKYDPGKYVITVVIKDKVENKEVASSVVVDWKN